jgi:hypothetical protein
MFPADKKQISADLTFKKSGQSAKKSAASAGNLPGMVESNNMNSYQLQLLK